MANAECLGPAIWKKKASFYVLLDLHIGILEIMRDQSIRKVTHKVTRISPYGWHSCTFVGYPFRHICLDQWKYHRSAGRHNAVWIEVLNYQENAVPVTSHFLCELKVHLSQFTDFRVRYIFGAHGKSPVNTLSRL